MIAIEGLSKSFTLHNQGGARIQVMQDAHLHVAPGECVALTGQSGAGKSTLMRMIYGNYLADVTAGLANCHWTHPPFRSFGLKVSVVFSYSCTTIYSNWNKACWKLKWPFPHFVLSQLTRATNAISLSTTSLIATSSVRAFFSEKLSIFSTPINYHPSTLTWYSKFHSLFLRHMGH